jgi:hypothetical protein
MPKLQRFSTSFKHATPMRIICRPSVPIFLFIFLSAFFAELAAQDRLHHHAPQNPVFLAIDEAVQSGELSSEDAILQKMYAGYKPERMDSRFRPNDEILIKCMVPVLAEFESIKNELNPAVIAEVETLLDAGFQQTTATSEYLSPSGNFIFFYDTEGNHAVPLDDQNGSGIPDYVEHAAFAADSSYRHQVERLGFVDFLQDEPYEITFRNLGFYGTTTQSGSTTRITVHRNFNNFPENTHPEGNRIGALYATIAHEIKHAIQYTSNRWRGDAGSFDWIEMDATLMEEVVFPNVNDYYNYIMRYDSQANDWNRNNPHDRSIFGNSESPTPGAYWHVTWMIYFQQVHGMDFWVDVWDVIKESYANGDSNNQISFLNAVQTVLTERNLTLEQEHIMNHMWHLVSGPSNSRPGFGFEDRMSYPNATIRNTVILPPDVPATVSEPHIFSFGAHYYDLMPSNVALGQPSFSLQSEVDGIGVGVLGYFRDGSTDVQLAINPNSNRQFLQTTWSWSDLVDLKLVVVNTNRNESSGYELQVSSSIPEEDAISQNYPNPFNPATKIEFSLNDTKDVKIEVFDRIGRKVSTLVNDRLNAGFHSVTFDGTGLASGVYFYRIVTDQQAITKKMVLVK